MPIIKDWQLAPGAQERDYTPQKHDKYYYADHHDSKPSTQQVQLAKKMVKKLKCREPDYSSRADVNMFICLYQTEYNAACRKDSQSKKSSKDKTPAKDSKKS